MSTITLTRCWKALLPAIGVFAAITSGCSSSDLTNEWRDPEFNQPMVNVLVVAAKHNPVNRRLWEDELAAVLSSYGVTSQRSYQLYPDSIPNPDQVGASVKERKFDGVLFIRRLSTEISTTVVPGTVERKRVTQYDARTQTYSTVYQDVQQASYTDTTRTVRQEVIVFAAQPSGGRMVWAATGELINPESRDEVRNEIAGLIVPELSKQGIIPAK